MYSYWGKTEPLQGVIERTRTLESGVGTFAVFLGCDALVNGFGATIYTYNLTVFDPTWFAAGVDITERLQKQWHLKPDSRPRHATQGYLEFLRLGGRLRLTDLSQPLIHGLLRRQLPILTGLSSTFLYRAPREYGPGDTPDDLRGFPAGHFVVIADYDREQRQVLVHTRRRADGHRKCRVSQTDGFSSSTLRGGRTVAAPHRVNASARA
jgi:hypothetical protein